MNSDVRDKISTAATAIEITLGAIILIACIVASLGMVFTTDTQQLFVSPDYLQERLSDACLIIIGIELIKMITSYTIDSVVAACHRPPDGGRAYFASGKPDHGCGGRDPVCDPQVPVCFVS